MFPIHSRRICARGESTRPIACRSAISSSASIRLHDSSVFCRTIPHSDPMGVEAVPLRLAIVWRTGVLRCEYWKAPGRPGHLRLYEGPLLRGIRVAGSVDEVRSAAAVWRTDLPAATGADRRLADRRTSTRSGRRSTDPIQTCSACGLPVGPQHRSVKECAAAVPRCVDERSQ